MPPAAGELLMAPMLVSAAKQVRQFICGLHGHDALLHFDQRHVSLRCVVCGHQSPGWNVPGAASAIGPADHVSRDVSPGADAQVGQGFSPGGTPRHAHRAA
jgi:hypothetical protein